MLGQDLSHGEGHDDHHDKHEEAHEEEAPAEKDEPEAKQESKDESKEEKGEEEPKEDEKKEDSKDEEDPAKSDKVSTPFETYRPFLHTNDSSAQSTKRVKEQKRDVWQAGRRVQYRNETL